VLSRAYEKSTFFYNLTKFLIIKNMKMKPPNIYLGINEIDHKNSLAHGAVTINQTYEPMSQEKGQCSAIQSPKVV